MKSCYCYETQKEYESITACFNELGLPKNKYQRATATLKHSRVVEIQGYHIGYNKKDIAQELDEWKQPKPELDVEVNRKGEVRKASTKTAKNPTYDALGYQYIIVRGDNKSKAYRVHRLVAEAFLPNYDEHLIIDHLNGVRDDNRVENLCVKTQTENLAARDERNAPLYQELRRLIMTYGYDETLEILQQF